MEKFVIQGSTPLNGEVKVEGAKNATLPIMAGCLLVEDVCHLENVPPLTDIQVMGKTLQELGAEVEEKEGEIRIDSTSLFREEAPHELARMLRASILVLGPLLARVGQARVALPGGCNIGSRPINLHIEGLTRMGAEISVRDGHIWAKATSGLKGARVTLDFPSVGATENIMLAAALAKGTTVIKNASLCPEVTDLAKFMRKAGVHVQGEGTNTLSITGCKRLSSVKHRIIPDRIEAGTIIIASVMTTGEVFIREARADHLTSLIDILREMGAKIQVESDGIQVGQSSRLHPIRIKTMPYPGFPTDLQPQITSLVCLAKGKSRITETVFENRFAHVPELKKMGAQITQENVNLTVEGIPSFHGRKVIASDIRGGAALVLAGLAARGETEIMEIGHIDRGYLYLEKKLQNLGAKIKRVRS